MIEREYVEKVMRTWNPHIPDHDIDSTYRYMQSDFQRRVEGSLKSKMEEYEAAGIPPGPLVEQLEGAFIEKAVLDEVIQYHLGEYLEEIEKRRRGLDRDYYAHLWTIQDPDGWKKTPWEIDINPELFAAVRQTFPEEESPFHVFTAARIEREMYASEDMPEVDVAFLKEIHQAVADWEAAGSPLEKLSFSHLTVDPPKARR
ncbi:hypothetical protein [Corynebacterium faecium]|uniref:hypothetical protein n=1 Tax=Corynebacterium faecium TaxID=3016001 RepID=UPI0022B4DD82|nr:hypothetical protein [Corynebacterium faecium]